MTHAHADHARPGSKDYLTVACGERILRTRLGAHAAIQTIAYGETVDLNGVSVSLHPAGHMLGSCQVRIEYRGEVWVVSGDYKVAADPTCEPFTPIRCHTFITESTFAHPDYVWPDQSNIWKQISNWWRMNRAWGRASVLYCYAAGKSQRVLAGIETGLGPLLTHEKVETVNADYRASGVVLPETTCIDDATDATDWASAMIIAPPQVKDGRWLRRAGPRATAFASGWMLHPRGIGRQRVDCGFVLSDHADWNETLWAIRETQAERVLVTHGHIEYLVAHLQSQGVNAEPLKPLAVSSPAH